MYLVLSTQDGAKVGNHRMFNVLPLVSSDSCAVIYLLDILYLVVFSCQVDAFTVVHLYAVLTSLFIDPLGNLCVVPVASQISNINVNTNLI